MDAEATPGLLSPALRDKDGLHVLTLSLMAACYIYFSLTALNWAQRHVCIGEVTDTVLSGSPSVKREKWTRKPLLDTCRLLSSPPGLSTRIDSITNISLLYLPEFHHPQLVLTPRRQWSAPDVVLLGGLSVKRVTGGTILTILAEPCLD
ncbi:hypothetical protein V5799_002217 [Amblyomma americanum]|uniref:Uncharacterized protein n=1 Tax=Amblyomma americanum TaxID=6943 RepID=A0AAQ4CXZ6_AMBAM